MDICAFLSHLPHQVSVGVNITTVHGDQVKRSGIASISDPPALSIFFADEELPPPETIHTESDCLVFFETGEVVTLICRIESIPNTDTLGLTAQNFITHVEKREYFRGPAARLDIAWVPSSPRDGPGSKSARGQGINISCGGILMNTDHPIAPHDSLSLHLHLPAPVNRDITCPARVLRVNTSADGFFFVALQFTDLDSDVCDDIMAFCFAEQRRHMREQVMTRDS